MSEQKPPLPMGDGDVPDKVLEELLAAFADDDTPIGSGGGVTTSAPKAPRPPVAPDEPKIQTDVGPDIDLDDPAIDALLGIEPAAPSADGIVTATVPATSVTSVMSGGDDPVTKPVATTGPGLAEGLAVGPLPIADPSESNAGQASPDEPIAAAPVRKPIQIGGSDDDLIDAVYLDEEGADRLRGDSGRQTEASVERTTILIGDDEIEGSAGGIPIATGPMSMDPRLRARRIAVKRAVGRRRLKWFVVGGAVVLVLTAVLAVLGSSLFEVKQVSPSGVSSRTRASYDAAVAQIEGHPVLLVDTHEIESQLEKNPWVREARVTTDFPDSAAIEIVERVPLATYEGADTRWRIIDVEGAVVDVIANRPLAFMPISGPGAEAESGGSAGDAFRHAAELIGALSPAARSRTEQVVVSNTGELSLEFESTMVVLGAPANLLDKLTWLEALLQDERSADCVVINVTTRDGGCVPA